MRVSFSVLPESQTTRGWGVGVCVDVSTTVFGERCSNLQLSGVTFTYTGMAKSEQHLISVRLVLTDMGQNKRQLRD